MTSLRRVNAVVMLLALTALAAVWTPVSAQDRDTCFGEDPTIEAAVGVPTVGTDQDDVIIGTDGPDMIDGGAGADLICGLGGPDDISGSTGHDEIDAGPGHDVVHGGPGADVIHGGPGADVIEGGSGHDDLSGNSGGDTIRGQNGSDTIRGGTGNDDIDGGKAGDTITGGPRRDAIAGGSGHDIIDGNGARDTISGGTGHDTIRGGGGRDTIDGGPGRDICLSGMGASADTSCLEGLRLTRVADLGDRAGLVIAAPGDDDRLFVVEQYHGIRIIERGELLDEPFVDLEDRVSQGNEQGVLGLAFHPDYAENGRFFVSYTARGRDNKIVEYRADPSDPNRADPDSNRQIIRIDQPHRWHNGGHIVFGPDGYLYIGIGDGGPGDDPNGTGQDTSNLLAGISRIDVDVDGDRYAIPEDNPFVGTDGRDELWAYGLRNPWRFSFDEQSERLFIGDVGQFNHDEIDVSPMDEGGVNYGWSITEGEVCFRGTNCDRSDIREPLIDIPHFTGDCSVIAGWVYRGEAIPELVGHFFSSDFCTRAINTFLLDDNEATQRTNWLTAPSATRGPVPIHDPPPGGVPPGSVTSLGLDHDGELYVATIGGTIYKIEPVR